MIDKEMYKDFNKQLYTRALGKLGDLKSVINKKTNDETIEVPKIKEDFGILISIIEELTQECLSLTNTVYDSYPSTTQLIIKSKKNNDYNMMEVFGAVEEFGGLQCGYEIIELLDKRIALSIFNSYRRGVLGVKDNVSWRTLFREESMEWNKNSKMPNLKCFSNKVNKHILKFSESMIRPNIAIMDSKTGELYLNIPGGNGIAYIYRESKKCVVECKSIESPYLGMMDFDGPDGWNQAFNKNIEFKTGKLKLEYGDCFIMIDHGIINNFRMLKNKNTDCDYDYFSEDRVISIINAVNTQNEYIFKRKSIDKKIEEFKFDFKNIQPTAKNTILAILSIERIFRIKNIDNSNTLGNVKMLNEIVDFLENTFINYDDFFSEDIEKCLKYSYFANIDEDVYGHDNPLAVGVKYTKDTSPDEFYNIDGKGMEKNILKEIEEL